MGFDKTSVKIVNSMRKLSKILFSKILVKQKGKHFCGFSCFFIVNVFRKMGQLTINKLFLLLFIFLTLYQVDAFTCPQGCICTANQHVNCQRRGLLNFPKGMIL